MNYFFVPGRKWLLAQAELKAVLQQNGIHYVELSADEKVMLYDIMTDEKSVEKLFYRLGGCVKFGMVVNDPLEYLNTLEETIQNKEKKLQFSISFYDTPDGERRTAEQRNKLGMEIKKWLRKSGYSVRFVSKFGTSQTSAVLMNTNHVLENGFEIVRFAHPKTGKTVWGVTVAFQDYEGFALRDYSRPRINKKKGMIPPKLARIMLNLAGIPKGGTVWDPFCGSGTIPMEALLLGYNVIASDIDQSSIEETKENLCWVCEKYWISHEKYCVLAHDVHDALPPDMMFDAVISEPYLGPVLLRKIRIEQINELTQAILPLFNALGNEIGRQIQRKRHGTIVIVIPGFRGVNGWFDMNQTFESNPQIRKDDSLGNKTAKPLQWDRPDSIIRRNISQFIY